MSSLSQVVHTTKHLLVGRGSGCGLCKIVTDLWEDECQYSQICLCASLAGLWPLQAVCVLCVCVCVRVCVCVFMHARSKPIMYITSSICLSRPPISLYCSVGFSSTSIALTRESYLVKQEMCVKDEHRRK